MPLFCTRIPEALLKLVTIINKIVRGQDLSKGPPKFGMMRNLVIIEDLRVFEQKSWERATETNANYELVMKDIISQFFPKKELQH